MENKPNGGEFINSTGKKVPQLFQPLHYMIHKKQSNSSTSDRKLNHSLFDYLRQLLSFLVTSRIRSLLSIISLRPKRTFQSAFSEESLAILSHSGDLEDALFKAQQYNIPLMQVVLMTSEGEATIKEKILTCFPVSHCINQNFVLYGDWENHKDLLTSLDKENIVTKQGIYLRHGYYVYAFISIQSIAESTQEILEENFIKVRNLYYDEEQSQIFFSHLDPQPTDFSPNPSMFGPQFRANTDPQSNFNDSDEEMENDGSFER